MLLKYGAGGFGYIASAQIASEGKTVGQRQYEHAAEMDLLKLAAVQNDRAIGSINKESDKLWSYLVNGEGSFTLLAGNEKVNTFTSGVLSNKDYGDAFALLNGLRDALKDSKDSVAGSIYSHDMLQYTTNAFRGSDGFDGLSGALFLANLASNDSARSGNATGYLINDVARTYEGEYLNINYDRSGSAAGGATGSQYYMNFNRTGPGYGNQVTGYFTGGKWVNSTAQVPSLDCIGYVNTVLYATGALKAGQALNASVKGNKVEVGIWSREYSSAHDKLSGGESGSIANMLSDNFAYGGWSQLNTDRQLAKAYTGGVLLAYGDDRKSWSNSPEVGSLVFMDGHVGFYGVDDQGRNLLVHSAPEYAAESGSYWESGPRENYLGSWTNQRLGNGNDEYTNMLVRNNYFTKWTAQFNPGYTFGKIRPWWDAGYFSRK